MERIRGLQEYALGLLFDAGRLGRMADNEAVNGAAAYSLRNLFDDTRLSIFEEVYKGQPASTYRRNLQRAYISRMGELMRLTDEKYARTDARALARGTLGELKNDIRKIVKGQKDKTARYHLEDLLALIDMIEKGEMPEKAASGGGGEESWGESKGCFED